MNKNQIEILKNLSWDNTPDKNKAGFIAALQETDHQYLLQLKYFFSSWDNCGIVFLMLGDEEIEPYLYNMLEWLQDYNWPGAEWIKERLQRTSSKLLVKPLERAARIASDNNDDIWLGWMSILIANPRMASLLDTDIFKLLKPFAVEYWNWDYDKMQKESTANYNKLKNRMQIVKEVIDEWDPIELFPHCPSDEYKMEIGLIHAYAIMDTDANTFATKIQEVFQECFGTNTFKKDFVECLKIAEIIKQKLKEEELI